MLQMLQIILNVANIRLSPFLHKTLSRPSFKNAWVLKGSTSIKKPKSLLRTFFSSCVGNTQTELQ